MPDPRHPPGTGSPSPGSGGRPFERRALQATLADVSRMTGDPKDDTSESPDADTGVTAGAGTARVGLAGREALAALAVEAAHATLAGRPAPNDATPTAGSPRSGVPGSRAPHPAGGEPQPPASEDRGRKMAPASLLGSSGVGPVRPLAPTAQSSALRPAQRQHQAFSEPPQPGSTGGAALSPTPVGVPTIPLRRLAAARSNQQTETSTTPPVPGTSQSSSAPHGAVTHNATTEVATAASSPADGSTVRPAANAAPWLPTDDDILPRRESRRRSFRSR